MKLRGSPRAGAALAAAAGAAALVIAAALPATASPLFTGGGRGVTAQNAIQSAFDDAQNTAQSEGFYGACTVSGEPQVFGPFAHPTFGQIFRAEVTVTCEP
ncbi:hypothetical protein [Cryptosporangium aurantiacum]|uniref:Uncharacterized protein n=1 Tax=Cryptosporangium aurantiacum TaxID=134849 RepID=A0A1M7PT10_9ACTN|nr:hypothetical protein [Cryptosporangium aurantiacum]SHN20552.1 hypothetical protein SAMN05443668_103651 [Cryptosporangium aurantiacum]